jgi:hypothetical protein
MTRRFDRCTDRRSRACRSGSIAQQRTLQYFAVALFTGAAHPRLAQMRRIARRESDPAASRSTSTCRSFVPGPIQCQRSRARDVREPPQKLHHRAAAAPVHSVDNSSQSDVSTLCAPVRNMCVQAATKSS